MKKPRIAHTQDDCPIRQRYGLPVTLLYGVRLSMRDTKVGIATVVECRYCYLRRLRKGPG